MEVTTITFHFTYPHAFFTVKFFGKFTRKIGEDLGSKFYPSLSLSLSLSLLLQTLDSCVRTSPAAARERCQHPTLTHSQKQTRYAVGDWRETDSIRRAKLALLIFFFSLVQYGFGVPPKSADCVTETFMIT